MHSPTHPGAVVRDNLAALGLSIDEGAGALGVDALSLEQLLSGQAQVSAEMALRLETVIGSTADHWMRMQTAHDLARIRREKANSLSSLRRLQPV